jgi:hypothetical protein
MYTPATDIQILSELPLAGQMSVKKLVPSNIPLGLDQRIVKAGVTAPVKQRGYHGTSDRGHRSKY